MPKPLRSDPAFLHDDETKNAISVIARSRKLVIFGGSGTTIDKSGVDWSGLVQGLLQGYVGADDIERFLERHGELPAASLAIELFRGEYSDKYVSRINSELRRLLYRSSNDTGGRLANGIALFALARQRAGLQTIIVTPNFDNYLEQALITVIENDFARSLRWGPVKLESSVPSRLSVHTKRTRFFRAGPDGDPIVRLPNRSKVALYFLHGYVPEDERSLREQRQGEPVILSESDYYATEESSSRLLRGLMTDASILIVGSSLKDPPLLRALHATATKQGLPKRFALLPLQGDEWSGLPDACMPALIGLEKKRLEHFGVTPLFPDFFFQVAQFAIEAAFAVDNPGYADPTFSSSYGKRLSLWWNDWWDQIAGDRLADTQNRHHVLVTEALYDIRSILRAPSSETLKLEVWIRWKPGDDSRRLRLWSSSTGSIRDLSTMRDAEITRASEYASMRIFCEGRPRLMKALTPPDRWRTYFGSPIYVPPVETQTPIGVITMASQSDESNGCLSPFKRSEWPTVVEIMRSLGDQVLKGGVAPTPPVRGAQRTAEDP